jgi:hypothetical protein
MRNVKVKVAYISGDDVDTEVVWAIPAEVSADGEVEFGEGEGVRTRDGSIAGAVDFDALNISADAVAKLEEDARTAACEARVEELWSRVDAWRDARRSA